MEYEELHRPSWLMTVRQADLIELIAKRKGKTVHDLVDEGLAKLGTQAETASLRRKLIEQLDWILAGKPPLQSPYYESFTETWDYPFHVRCRLAQVDMEIDKFIEMVRN